MAKSEPVSHDLTLHPGQVPVALKHAFEAGLVPMIHGGVGVGKSDTVAQYAREHNLNLVDIRTAQLDPVDLRGLPHVNGDGLAHWAPASFLPQEGCDDTLVFFDEVNRGTALVQNSCLQLMRDRKLGDYVVPENVLICAAGNRESDGGGVIRLTSALNNRFLHLNVEPDLDAWAMWAAKAQIDPLVIAFLRWQPQLHYAFDRDSNAFPTPRSWEFVSRILKTRPAPREVEMALLQGCIGKGAMVHFEAFIKTYRGLPDIDQILAHPDKADVPDDMCIKYATIYAVSFKATPANLANVLRYLERVETEFAVFAIRDAIRRNPALENTKEFKDWALKNADRL